LIFYAILSLSIKVRNDNRLLYKKRRRKPSEQHGFGLMAIRHIPDGAFVGHGGSD
jgi:hypothetical protein